MCEQLSVSPRQTDLRSGRSRLLLYFSFICRVINHPRTSLPSLLFESLATVGLPDLAKSRPPRPRLKMKIRGGSGSLDPVVGSEGSRPASPRYRSHRRGRGGRLRSRRSMTSVIQSDQRPDPQDDPQPDPPADHVPDQLQTHFSDQFSQTDTGNSSEQLKPSLTDVARCYGTKEHGCFIPISGGSWSFLCANGSRSQVQITGAQLGTSAPCPPACSWVLGDDPHPAPA